MGKLADSIERMVKSGSMSGGFFTQFFKGFERGVKWSKDFRGLMWDIRKSLRITRYAGMELGRAFVKAFPGVKDMLVGLREIFNPTKFRKLTSGVVDIFKQFFNDVAGNDKQSFPNLMKALKEKFFDFFDSNSGAGSKFINGLKTFGKAIVNIIAGMVTMAIDGLKNVFVGIAEWIKTGSFPKMGGASSAIGDFLQPLIDAFTGPGATAMLDAFTAMFKEIWAKAKPILSEFWEEWKLWFYAYMFGPAFFKGIVMTVGSSGAKLLVGAFAKLGKKAGSALTDGITSAGVQPGWFKRLGMLLGGGLKKAAVIAATFAFSKAGAIAMGAFGLALAGGLAIGTLLDNYFDISGWMADAADRIIGQTAAMEKRVNAQHVECVKVLSEETVARIKNKNLSAALAGGEINSLKVINKLKLDGHKISLADEKLALINQQRV